MASGQDPVTVPEDEEMGNPVIVSEDEEMDSSVAVVKDEEVDDAAQGEAETAETAETCDEFLGHIPTVIELDKRGDIELSVGRNECSIADDGSHLHWSAERFRVCSRALARSSPVMETMLFGESSETNQSVISLPDDDPDAMELLLHISHGNSAPIYDVAAKDASFEATVAFVDQVYEIVSLAHKYQMTQHLRPWASFWTEPLCNNKKNYGFERLEKTLFIASVFGDIRLYGLVSADLVWFQKGRQKLFSDSLDPDKAKGHLGKRRRRHIKDILDILDAAIKALLTGVDSTNQYLCNFHTTHYGNKNPIQGTCGAYTVGILMQNLARESLWPIPDAHTIHDTPQAIHDRLTSKLWKGYDPYAFVYHDCLTKRTLDRLLKARGWDYSNRIRESIHQDLLVRAESFGLPQYAKWPVPESDTAKRG